MWKNKNVWILLAGEFVAGLGLWIGIIGNLEFMQDKIPSDFLKSLILAVGLLAGLAVGPLAGKITDQVSKKTVMLVAGFVRIISVGFMLLAIETGSVWWMIIFLVVTQISASFFFPALQAAIPLVVKEKDLLQLNGAYMNVSSLSRIMGTAVAGIFLVIMSLSMLYIISLLAYLGLFILTIFLTIDEAKTGETNEDGAAPASIGFKELFPVIKGVPIVLMTLVMTLIPLLFLGGFNLLVINISELQDSSSIKSWIYTAEGVSFMLGAFFVKQLSEKFSPHTILFFFSFCIGISQAMLYFANVPILSIAAFLLFGFAVGTFFPTAATIFQTKVPKDFHGRFFSFHNMLERLIYQLMLLLTGFMLDAVGLQHMTVMFGALSLTMTTIFYVKFRQLRQVKLPLYEKNG
ncbi:MULTISPECIES: MFS transporter [Metabacillus]|jgi:MFS transporter, DHA3 family, macrolide efflux protein|uniref:MFS transporter n=1 Tax=Metabacillus rhizolycopersici TaxID=2875709 RepID=A0ABS7UXW3_9BACI|nr:MULTISPECIES: MFS transporter [Metabacillus]MBZ5752838.1 MFS transporter [Metabacillus rhizolycopersici]MCM3654643.1 MFS transporter [Metabacillus litoralis]